MCIFTCNWLQRFQALFLSNSRVEAQPLFAFPSIQIALLLLSQVSAETIHRTPKESNMSDGEQSPQENSCFPLLSSCFRSKKKASSQQDTYLSVNFAPEAEASPVKSAPETRPSDVPVPPPQSFSPGSSFTPKPAIIVREESVKSSETMVPESDLWFWAYQKLDEKSQKWILGTSEPKPESGKQWTMDLITLVREREEAYKDSTPKLKVGSHEIIWRDYANKTVTWLMTIGEIAANFTLAPSPIIWSTLKVFMKVCSRSILKDILLLL